MYIIQIQLAIKPNFRHYKIFKKDLKDNLNDEE